MSLDSSRPRRWALPVAATGLLLAYVGSQFWDQDEASVEGDTAEDVVKDRREKSARRESIVTRQADDEPSNSPLLSTQTRIQGLMTNVTAHFDDLERSLSQDPPPAWVGMAHCYVPPNYDETNSFFAYPIPDGWSEQKYFDEDWWHAISNDGLTPEGAQEFTMRFVPPYHGDDMLLKITEVMDSPCPATGDTFFSVKLETRDRDQPRAKKWREPVEDSLCAPNMDAALEAFEIQPVINRMKALCASIEASKN